MIFTTIFKNVYMLQNVFNKNIFFDEFNIFVDFKCLFYPTQ